MEFVPLITAAVVIPLFIFIFRKNFFVEVKDPNGGIVYYLNQLVEGTIIPPGTHFLIQKIGPIWINRVVIMPGREIIIDIHVDVAFTQNVQVTIDVRLILQLQLDEKGFPTFDSAAKLVRWIHLAPGETLFSTYIGDEFVKGKLDERLTSLVNDAVSKVVIRYTPYTITSSPEVFEELVREIRSKIWREISRWAGKLIVEIEHIEVPDEVTRTRIKEDAKAQAQVIYTEERAQLEMDKEYRDAFGEGAALMRITGRSLKGSNLNVFSDGFGGLIRTLSTLNPPPPDVTGPVRTRMVRRKKPR